MHRFDEGRSMLGIDVLVDPVTEVEYVTATLSIAVQDCDHLLTDSFR